MAAKDDADILAQFAQWLGLDEKEIDGFVNEGMKRKGHKQVTTWADSEDNNKKNEGGFFGGGGQGSGFQYNKG